MRTAGIARESREIRLVQRLLGHANISTTVRYLHLNDTDLADAVDLAFPVPNDG
jgi:site-specific recombinase XerC